MSQKWNLQDIRPAGARRKPAPSQKLVAAVKPKPPTTTDVEVGERRPARTESTVSTDDGTLNFKSQPTTTSIPIEDGRKRSGKRLLLAFILCLVVIGGSIGLSAVLGKTELVIYPQSREPNVNAEFTAYPERRDDALTYEILTLESQAEKQVRASGETEVKEQATGLITIKKTTPGAERLIKNTRFRTPEGLVFRIQESVDVPGAVNGNPGTIQAEVFADEVGEQYNIAANTTFDVPGFQESGLNALYDAITASNGAGFTGGFNGQQFQIDEAELSTARQELQVQLRNELLAKIDTAQPADFVTFKDAVAITYNQLPAVEYGNELVTIKEQAILQVPLFKKTEFGTYLANETLPTAETGPVRVDDPSKLTFAYTTATTSSSVLANQASLSFKLTGKPLLVWEYDQGKLTTDLAGLPKTALQNAINAYPGIKGARARITPFWKRSFPENPEEIQVIETLEEPQ